MKKLFKLAIVVAVVKVGYDRMVKRNLKKESELVKSPGVTVGYDRMVKQTPIRSGRYPWGEGPKSP